MPVRLPAASEDAVSRAGDRAQDSASNERVVFLLRRNNAAPNRTMPSISVEMGVFEIMRIKLNPSPKRKRV